MASAPLSSRTAHTTRPDLSGQRSWSRRFAGDRAKEAGYGLFFASVFLLCQSPVNALVIDDIRVLSRLGEPLVAEVAVSPAAGEALNRACFSTQRSAGGLPDIGAVRLALIRGADSIVLRIAGSQPVREPMSEFVLQVKCAGVATFVKSFLVMVDPPTTTAKVSAPASTAAQTQPAPAQIATQSASRPSALPERALPRRLTTTASQHTPIQPGTQYRVRPGDTLSRIASRVAGRPDWSVWPIAQHIYATNTGAFLLGDPNVIAEGAVVFVPRLADVNMDRTAADIRTAAKADPAGQVKQTATPPLAAPVSKSIVPASIGQSTTAQTTAARTTVPQTTIPEATVAQTAIAPATPAPIVTMTETAPLASMQLTINLFDESLMKIELRGQGLPVTATLVTADPAPQTPVGSTPDPQGSPERPDDATTDSRAVIQPTQPAAVDSQLNWLWIAVGLFTGLLIGALAAVSLFRRNLRHEYEHDVRDAVQRQIHTDRQRAREQTPPASATSIVETPVVAAAVSDPAEVSGTVETPQAAVDQTVEMSTVENIDFDMTPQDEPARTGAPETLEMPGIANDLDLELTPDTGKTGQHEVDYDLLEAAYSEDYQSEFVNTGSQSAGNATVDTQTEGDGDDERYYHLENRDPTDEAPLPIELGDDEMGNDDNGVSDGKVVRFRR